MTNPLDCGPAYLGIDEIQATILGSNDMARAAFRMATVSVTCDLLAQAGDLPLSTEGTRSEAAAKLLATTFAVYDDQGRGGEPHVYGPWVFVPQSTADRALEQGQDAFTALLLRGADRAAQQPETEDRMDFFVGLLSNTLIEDLAETTLPLGSRKTRYAIAALRSQETTWEHALPEARNEADFMALVAGGGLHVDAKAFFKNKNTQPSEALKSFITVLNQADDGNFVRMYHAVMNSFNENDRSAISRMADLIKAQPNVGLRGDFIALATAPASVIPPTTGGLYTTEGKEGERFAQALGGMYTTPKMEEGERFAQARALWRQSQGRAPHTQDAQRLAWLFLLDAEAHSSNLWVVPCVHARSKNTWTHSLRWMANSQHELKDPQLVAHAHRMVPGLLIEDTEWPQAPADFLKAVFDKPTGGISVPVGITTLANGEELAQRVVEKVVELHDGSQHVDAIYSRVFKGPCLVGGGRLELLDKALEHEELVEILAKHKPNAQELKNMRKALNEHGLPCPRVVFLMDQEWRRLNGHEYGQDNFERAWKAWIKDDKPHMETGQRMSMSLWRSQALGKVADEQDGAAERRPKPKM